MSIEYIYFAGYSLIGLGQAPRDHRSASCNI